MTSTILPETRVQKSIEQSITDDETFQEFADSLQEGIEEHLKVENLSSEAPTCCGCYAQQRDGFYKPVRVELA